MRPRFEGRIRLAATLLAACLLSACFGPTEPEVVQMTVEGRVTLRSSGEPVSGAVVRLAPGFCFECNYLAVSPETDAAGWYHLITRTSVCGEGGSVEAVIESQLYMPTSEVVQCKEGTQRVDFLLDPLPKSE